MKRKIPLLKEYRLNKLVQCLICFDTFSFDRKKQRECVLANYEIGNQKDVDHWDKSVFRGMVIPSLKYLELLYGQKDEHLLSANGKILVESYKMDRNLHILMLRTIIYWLDKNIYRFLGYISENYMSKIDFLNLISEDIVGDKIKPKKERINKWTNILSQVELIDNKKGLKVNKINIETILVKSNFVKSDIEMFKNSLFSSYKKLALKSAGIVKIEDLRKEVMVDYIINKQMILISSIFDELLRKIPLSSSNYMISFGQPMGAKEMLFLLNEKYFNTIHIKF